MLERLKSIIKQIDDECQRKADMQKAKNDMKWREYQYQIKMLIPNKK